VLKSALSRAAGIAATIVLATTATTFKIAVTIVVLRVSYLPPNHKHRGLR
jgi:hypothetical protein